MSLPARPFSMHGLLFLGDKPNEEWSIADPTDEATHEAARAVHSACYSGFPNPQPEKITIERKHLVRLLQLAEAYSFLGTYDLGTGCVVEKLRQVRAVLRAMGRAA